MRKTLESLLIGYKPTPEGSFSFKFGDNNEYELCFEPLLLDGQVYVALYKDQSLLTDKVVLKIGYE
jgi:hypothetical protein